MLKALRFKSKNKAEHILLLFFIDNLSANCFKAECRQDVCHGAVKDCLTCLTLNAL